MRVASLLALVLAGCGQPAAESAGAELEREAIAAGVVRDPGGTAITGLYARDTDRLCIVPAGDGYRIGAAIDYGGGQHCGAAGSVTRDGETLKVVLDGAQGCTFAARLEGDRIVFPGRVPNGCARLCSSRASFAALEVELQSDVIAEASTLRDPAGRLLCGS